MPAAANPSLDPPATSDLRSAVYLDCAASTPTDPAVTAMMMDVQGRVCANSASVHRPGLRAAREVERARIRIAERLGCAPDRITFMSCATEANNFALKGAIWSPSRRGRHLVISAVEHPSVHEVASWLQSTGQATVTWVPVDKEGRVAPADVAGAIQPDTALVSVMHVNNEVGTIQPIAEIGALCRSRGVLFHTDACQSFLKVPIDLGALQVDLLTLNAHKVHGPKGVGAIYIRDGVTLAPLLHGGGHEQNVRSGTLNVAGIAGFGEAVVRYGLDESDRIGALRDGLVREILRRFDGARINSPATGAVCNIVNLAFPGHSGKQLFMDLDRSGVQVSASSACHSTKLTPSHVLLAMGFDDLAADEALRVSLGRFTTQTELDALLGSLAVLLRAAPGCLT